MILRKENEKMKANKIYQGNSLDVLKRMYDHTKSNPAHNNLEKSKLSFWKKQIRGAFNEVS